MPAMAARVAHFASIQNAVTTGRQHAIRPAGIRTPSVPVAVIALLAQTVLHDAVTAVFKLAGRGSIRTAAAVAGVDVAIIALLARIQNAVAAGQFFNAPFAAAVARNTIPIVALLTRVQDAVAADIHEAIAAVRIERIITLFAPVNDSVTTIGKEARCAAGIRLRITIVQAVVTLLAIHFLNDAVAAGRARAIDM